MKRVTSPVEMQRISKGYHRTGRRVGLVPTMGALHEGHLSLIRRIRASCDVLVVSIFVNQLQFAPSEDFAQYPRDLERDAALCEAEGVDIIFCPSPADVYFPDHSVFVDEESLSEGLCGASRPCHFKGVATVVAKLLNLVLPDVAVFGQKDAQQVAVIRRMVRDLNFPVRIDVAPIVREPDGLAMSSRNAYLSEEERKKSLCLSRALRDAHDLVAGGTQSAAELRSAMMAVIDGYGDVVTDYVEIVDPDTLKPVDLVTKPALVVMAVRVGRTRLIDNTVLMQTS